MTYDLRTFQFGAGSHDYRDEGMCVMEAVAYLAGEPHSDSPKCASVVITKLAIWVNDSCSDTLRNELLRDLPWRIVGTKASDEIEQQRAYMAADWAVRVVCPILLRGAGLEAEAVKLESLAVVDGDAAYAAARADAADAALAAADAADAALAAAYAAARADAAHAARAAHAAHAAHAARAAHAAHAARAAALAAAYAAADAALAAHAALAALAAAYAAADAAADLEVIQRSCVALIDRMIRLTEPQEAVRVCEKVVAEN